MKTKYIISVALLVLIASGFIGCDLLKKRVEKKESTSFTINSSGKSTLKIKNTSGNIKVTKAKDSVKTISVTTVKYGRVKPGDLDKPLDNIQIKIDSSADIITLESEIQTERGWLKNIKSNGTEVDYDVVVPANIKVNIDNVNGNLTLDYIGNDVEADMINGKINCDGCYGSLNLNLTNGDVNANIDSTKGIKVDIVNGTVKMGRLKNISAEVSANVVNGKVKFDDLVLKNVSSDKKNLKGILGDGKSSIKLSSVNGSIILSESDILMKIDKSRRNHFEGIQFNFDEDDFNNGNVKVQVDKIEPKTYKNEKTAYDSLKAAYDSLKNKMNEEKAAPKR